MGFKCGLVGLPNVGKSTIFNSLTKGHVASENYPFCTIDPHVGIVQVPDLRLAEISKIVKPEKTVPTTMEFIDIAGLVKGASHGEGLGNQFLSHIRETDAIAHVVRCFHDENIIHVAGEVDPLADIDVIETELVLADLQAAEKALLRATKNAKAGQKELVLQKNTLTKVFEHLNQALPLRSLSLTSEEISQIQPFSFLTMKPLMYIANVDETGLQNNPLVDKVRQFASQHQASVVTICAAIEAALVDLTPEDQQELLATAGIKEPGLNQVIRTGYELLNLQTYFTAGVKEVRAWTILKNSTAPQAAGKIHTDFTKGFIRAEVISYNDFIQYQGEQGAKEAGRWRLEGKEYIVQDGDIMHFRFNV